MFFVLTLTCLGLILVSTENTDHVPAKIMSFTSSHLPDHYTFTYEMDDGTLHKEEGRLVDGAWVVASQFSCSNDDSPMQTFSFIGNKCGFNRRNATPLGLTDKMGETFMESHGQTFQSQNAVPFSNDTDVPLRIGLPISPNEPNFLKAVSKTDNVFSTTIETDINSHSLEANTSKEGNATTDDRPADGYNKTHPKLRILEIPHKDNFINKSDMHTNETGSPESTTTLNKTEESVQLKHADLIQPADNRSPQGERNELPTEGRNKLHSSESGNMKTESEKPQVSINSLIEGQGNHSQKHPIIKRVQVTRHPENPDVEVNISMANISEMQPDHDQPFSDDQLTGNNRSSNFQVFFKKARNMTVDSQSHNLFPSSDMNKDIFYNSSRAILEAFLNTDNVPYSIFTEAIPNNRNYNTSDAYTTPLPEVKVVGPV